MNSHACPGAAAGPAVSALAALGSRWYARPHDITPVPGTRSVAPEVCEGGRDLDSAGVSHADLHGSRRPELPLEGLGKARVQCRLVREEGAVSSRMRYSVSLASLKCG